MIEEKSLGGVFALRCQKAGHCNLEFEVKDAKPLFRKSSPGGCLQVAFKLGGPFPAGESDGRFDTPWAKFCRVRDFASVMCIQTFLQIFRETDVEMRCNRFALQNVNVEEFHPIQLACRAVAWST